MGARRGISVALLSTALAAQASCAVPRQMLATPGDLRDYREFRTAAHEGRLLAMAQRYLARHPDGAWAAEVRPLFEAEEEAWFESAKSSRSRAREYVIDLPDGPHVETLTLLADSRRMAAKLDVEGTRRKHVSDVMLAAIAALLDPATWGTRLD